METSPQAGQTATEPLDQIVVSQRAIESAAASKPDLEGVSFEPRAGHRSPFGQHPEGLLQRRLRDARGVADPNTSYGATACPANTVVRRFLPDGDWRDWDAIETWARSIARSLD